MGSAAVKINVLGTDYAVIERGRCEDKQLDDKDGYCDDSVKEIIIAHLEPEPDSKKDLNTVHQKILRHEIVHAFLCESGLSCNSDWAENEELVDWIAIQGPKLIRAWQEANAL